jgi:hypothetical protein
VLVQQLLGQSHGLVDLADDDPLVGFAAVTPVFDDLPGQPVSEQAGSLLFCWQPAPQGQLEQFAGTHPGRRR